MLMVLVGIKSEVFIWTILFRGHHMQIIAMPVTIAHGERGWKTLGLNAVG